jgi:L-aspartate oxidase
MAGYHPQGDLAPRDIVARAIHAEREAGRGAFLDARAAIGTHFPVMFPAVFAACQSAGIDPRIEPIPVAPACHYHMGGILTDAHGATSLPGLLAVGECASTGIHGANRLASNSLVEAAVFGRRAGRLARTLTRAPTPLQTSLRLQPLAPQGLRQLRQAMSRHAGVIRDREGLTALIQMIDALLRSEGQAGALVTARMIAQCALDRLESRGAHFRTDHPEPAPLASRTIFTLKAGDFARMAA